MREAICASLRMVSGLVSYQPDSFGAWRPLLPM